MFTVHLLKVSRVPNKWKTKFSTHIGVRGMVVRRTGMLRRTVPVHVCGYSRSRVLQNITRLSILGTKYLNIEHEVAPKRYMIGIFHLF